MSDDKRTHSAWEAWTVRQREEDPAVEYSDLAPAYRPFMDGWHARTEAAMRVLPDADMAIVQDQIDMLRKGNKRIFDMLVQRNSNDRMHSRMVDALRRQVAMLRGDPIDAPAYRRIIMQRQEIKRITNENADLRIQLAMKEKTTDA